MHNPVNTISAAHKSLGVDLVSIPVKKKRADRIRQLLKKFLGHHITDCPDCGAVDSLVRILLPPNARAPPAAKALAPAK